jgi:hypothetical protein
MDFDTKSNREQSEFNSAITYLNRLNALFYAADENSIALNGYNWYHTLLCIYRELSTEMSKEELNKLDSDSEIIKDLVNKEMLKQSKGISRGMSSELYKRLHSFELSLRSIMKESGLQLKMKEDAAKALR